MNKLCCLIIIFSSCRFCDAQNLVPNPSFEDTVGGCPSGFDQIYKALGWSSFGFTPDYYNSCGLPFFSVPFNWCGYQSAATGNAYGGLIGFTGGGTEIIGTSLIAPLVLGIKYYVSFKVALSVKNGAFGTNNYASNKLGAMFSTVPYTWNNNAPITNNPPIYTDSLITDTVNWTIIRGSFIADSSYNYVLFGNFFDANHTDTLRMLTTGSYALSYYYIDDVCVSTDSLTCFSSVGFNEIKNVNDLILFPNPFTDKINITTKINGPLEVTFYDITSRKILTQSFTTSTTINTSQLAKGIYLYEVRNKNGVIKKGKVVKE